MDAQPPKTIQMYLEQAQAEREHRLAERLAEIERERAVQSERLEAEFGTFYASVEALVPEHLRPYVCAPQRFGEDKIPSDYHFNQFEHYLAFDIPGLAPILALQKEGGLVYFVPGVDDDDYGDQPVCYSWWRKQQTSDVGEALLLARNAHEEYWQRTETVRRRAEERERRQSDAAEARRRLVERIVDDPLLRLLALVVAQVQAERESFEEELDAAQADAEAARNQAVKARREVSSAHHDAEENAREADSLRWELERLERALASRRGW